MPYLIDGNNLLFALYGAAANAERLELCRRLAEIAAGGEAVCVAFDGPPPDEPMAALIAKTGVEAIFSGPRPADELLLRRIAESSAPKHLTVVSTDREIREAASRRKCIVVRSEDFARVLERPPRPAEASPPPEPAQKRKGLSPAETQRWLREFGIEE